MTVPAISLPDRPNCNERHKNFDELSDGLTIYGHIRSLSASLTISAAPVSTTVTPSLIISGSDLTIFGTLQGLRLYGAGCAGPRLYDLCQLRPELAGPILQPLQHQSLNGPDDHYGRRPAGL